jgi:hypothetical protein
MYAISEMKYLSRYAGQELEDGVGSATNTTTIHTMVENMHSMKFVVLR